MGKKDFCIYADTCALYQGKEDKKGTDLLIYKNVFCHRGFKGWNNCKRYLDFQSKSNTPIDKL